MEKIVVDYVYKNYFSARSKAREDVNHIAQNNGFKPFLINTRTTTEQAKEKKQNLVSRLLYNFRKLFILCGSLLSIKKGTVVLFQYPFAPFGEFFTLFFCRCLKMKKCHLVLLVHDLVHYRETKVFNNKEIKILNTASELIVHNNKTQELFKSYGVDKPCHYLWLFDYLTDEIPNPIYDGSNTIAFAGALDKSIFLKKLQGIPFKNIQLHLYGGQPQDTSNYPDWMSYIGRFSPENVTMLHEEWGLSWDGEGIDSLQGVIGNYLKYISPHKVSLYIAAGIPVIISKESALAEYVEENKLGISISSLTELEERVINQDKEEMQLIRKHVLEMSAVLRRGGNLSAILENIINEKSDNHKQSYVHT
jgi:hypothetical protein